MVQALGGVNIMDAQELYFKLPIFAQEWAMSWYARRLEQFYFGGDHRQWIARYQVMERWPQARLEAYQLQQLRYILDTAFTSVPWFRALARQQRWRLEDFITLEDVRHLPIMEKDPIRLDPWPFVREDYPRQRLWLEKTSGTTGKSLHIYWPREALPRWWAITEARARGWAGISQQTPRAMVGGRPVVPGNTTQPPFWRYNRRWQQLYLSSYHISPATIPAYIDAIERYGCEWITGYGSAISLLGEYLCAHPRQTAIRAAIVSGDTTTPRQRQAIEQGFGCKMYDTYSSVEGCCAVTECEEGRLHLSPEAGILEILDQRGEPCPPGVEGEFICTGFGNDVMPLIRYRLGDYGAWAVEQECPCGRTLPVLDHVTGRTDDYLELPDGRRVGRLSTAMKKAPSVKQAQLVQDTPDHAWLLVVPEESYTAHDGEALVEDVCSRIGTQAIDIEVRPVTTIPRLPSGKHVLVRRIMDNAAAQAQYRSLLAGETVKERVA